MSLSSEKSSQRGERVLPGSQMVYFVKGILGKFGMVESAHWTVVEGRDLSCAEIFALMRKLGGEK